MKNFNQTVTKELIKKAISAKEKGESLSKVFLDIAVGYGYSTGSVRNHYYKVVKNTPKSDSLYQKLGLVDRLKPIFIEEFTRAEEKDLLYQIIKGVASGKSVRKTVYELSSGNEKLALRYQNKFRNLVKTNSPLLTEVTEKVEGELGVKVNFKKRVKQSEYLRLEREINQMLDKIVKSVCQENFKLKSDAEKLKKENAILKSVVKKTMQEKEFEKFAKTN